MKQRYILFRRSGVFYQEDTTTGKQLSLRTKDEAEARTLLNAKNESFRQPVLNRQIARTYLAATDSGMATRIWQVPMDEMTKTKTGSTRVRHECASSAAWCMCAQARPNALFGDGTDLKVRVPNTSHRMRASEYA